jgi:hypothetical protein
LLKLRNLFISVLQLVFEGVLVLLLLCGSSALGNADKLIFPMAVEIGEQFEANHYEKENYAPQLEKIVQGATSFDGIPAGQGSHDYLPVVLAIGAAFLGGF